MVYATIYILLICCKTFYSLRPFFIVQYSILGCPLISVHFVKLVGKSWCIVYFVPKSRFLFEK
ncbi:hypothetical protein RHMOL_Rhmol09G0028400 [Rhododendron molle]|uniref:Uncharacterized protein n=1 Tax=Rhododendron molle TaxID=49168 RepID=A0ACC0M986_RHOML|nr:hypothetical protein RHMOL_Rhmol09G0028400 [Rhododendron molle]